MSDDGVPADADEHRWRVRQVRDAGGIRSRVEGPAGQTYRPHAVKGLRVTEVCRLHDALKAYPSAPGSRERQARLLGVLADAITHPMGLQEL